MNNQKGRANSLFLVAGASVLAAVLGYGTAQWVAAKKEAPAVKAAAADAPKAAAGNSKLQEIDIPADYLAASKIAVEPVGSGAISAEVLINGTVVPAPNSEAVVVARAAGNVMRVTRQLGDTVRAGEVLAQVESLEAASMAADRNASSAKLDLARKNHAREANLFAQGITPRQDLEAAQSALSVAQSEAQRAVSVAQAAHVAADGKSIAVSSPIAGKVTLNAATLGGYVQPQTEMFRVAGAGSMQVEGALPAADVARVTVGDKATIVASGGTPVAATVRSITPNVSGSTRAATAVLVPVTAGRDLIAGEGVQVRLHVKDASSGLMVPEDAVQNVDGHDVLFVRTKDGFRIAPVLVASRSHGVAQIVSGVKAGEQVATRNAFLVKADMIKSAKDE